MVFVGLWNSLKQATSQQLTFHTTAAATNENTMAPISSTLALGAGCYWGTEKYIVKDFQSPQHHPGCIANAKVGFMSPDVNAMKNPSYRQVCSGSTGHVEVLNIELKPDQSTTAVFEDLIKFFFMFHDPTTLNRQGNDAGTQYASVIFCSSEEQKQIAERVKAELQQALDAKKVKGYEGRTIHTLVTDYTTFYEAHQAHQEYLAKNPVRYSSAQSGEHCDPTFFLCGTVRYIILFLRRCRLSHTKVFFCVSFCFLFQLGYCNHRYRFKEWPVKATNTNGEL